MNKKISILNKIQAVFYQNGFCGVMRKIKQRTLHNFFYTTCSTWYERNLNNSVNNFVPDIKLKTDFLVREKERLITWLQDNKTKFSWIYFEKEIDAAIKNDHIFLIISHQTQIVGYVKIGIGQVYIHDFDQLVSFPPDTAFIYDIFILPRYRGKKLSFYALNQVIEHLKNKNLNRVLCHIENWNLPSIKSFQKAGFQAIESIRFVRVASFPFFLQNRFLPFSNLERRIHSISMLGEKRL